VAEPHPPSLPEGAPKGLRDFIECREPSVAIGRKAVVVLQGAPDEGAWPSEIQPFNGQAAIIVDGNACPQTTARSKYSNLTIEGLSITPTAINADGSPAGFIADLPS
jgi:hypothetical protein